MSNQEKLAAGMMLTGFALLMAGIAAFSVPGAAIVGGVMLIAFGALIDKAAS